MCSLVHVEKPNGKDMPSFDLCFPESCRRLEVNDHGGDEIREYKN